jgi:hypothetical protein
MRPESFKITLAGVDYDCPPLTLGQAKALRVGVIRDAANTPAADDLAAVVEHNHDYNMSIVATALSHKHPGMTKAAIYDIPGLTFDDLDAAALAVLRASGWIAKAGEAPAPVPATE